MRKKVIVLGSGLVGKPIALDLCSDFEVTVSDINPKRFDGLAEMKTIQADLTNPEKIRSIVSDFDYVINALPGFLGFSATKAIVETGRNLVDISFFPEDATEIDAIAKEKKITAIVDCGVAPGMSYILAGYAHNLLDRTDKIEIYVGGLPKIRTWPWEYKAVFSPMDVIEEYTRPARYVKDGQIVIMEALSEPELMDFDGLGSLEAFNTDGLRSLIHTLNCPNMIEKTLRYPGHIDKIKLLKQTGFFSTDPVTVEGTEIIPLHFTSKLLFPAWELKEGDEDITVMKVRVEGVKKEKFRKQKAEIAEEKDGEIVFNLAATAASDDWIRAGRLIRDGKMKEYEDMDNTPMYTLIEDPHDVRVIYQWDLLDSYDKTSGIHSMARTTGYTATMALRMLDQGLFSDKGLIYPEYIGKHPECVNFILDGLKERGVVYNETIIKEEIGTAVNEEPACD